MTLNQFERCRHFLRRSWQRRCQAKAIVRILIALAFGAVAIGVAMLVLVPRTPSDSPGPALTPPAPPRVNVAELQAKADKGDAAAMNALGKAYQAGQSVKVDYERAAELFRKAADLGNADAQANLGMLYDAGQGVPTDFGEAMKWFKKAAEQNHAEASYNVASLYASGRGVPQNTPEATKWYSKAAQLGDAFAQYNVAQRYQLGKGVTADPVEAYKWYELAARQGVPDAAEARDKLKGTLSKQQIQEAMGRVGAFKPAGNPPASP